MANGKFTIFRDMFQEKINCRRVNYISTYSQTDHWCLVPWTQPLPFSGILNWPLGVSKVKSNIPPFPSKNPKMACIILLTLVNVPPSPAFLQQICGRLMFHTVARNNPEIWLPHVLDFCFIPTLNIKNKQQWPPGILIGTSCLRLPICDIHTT